MKGTIILAAAFTLAACRGEESARGHVASSGNNEPASPAGRCVPDGAWNFTMAGASEAGKGCGPKGARAQGPISRAVTVTTLADGSLGLSEIKPAAQGVDGIEVAATAAGKAGACVLKLDMRFHFDQPVEGGIDRSSFHYSDTLTQGPGGTITGSGTVQTAATFIDAAEQSTQKSGCTEATASTGSLTVL
jgi:hypothetical protein